MLTATVTAWLSPAENVTAAAAPVDVDQALVRQAAAGDSAAFEALYRRHAGRYRQIHS